MFSHSYNFAVKSANDKEALHPNQMNLHPRSPSAVAPKRGKERFRAAVRKVILMHRFRTDVAAYYHQVATTPRVAATGEVSQVGGHESTFLKLESGMVAKIADVQELEIYPLLCREFPHEFIPKFSGVMTDSAGRKRIILEDLTEGFIKPCVMDIKMGTKTYEQEAGVFKKMKLGFVDKISSTQDLGCRMVGLSVTQPLTGKSISLGKRDSIFLTDARNWFQTYLNDGATLRRDTLPIFLQQISQLKSHFKLESRWEFLGSSLLFIYDADRTSPKPPLVRMIDFAHTRRLAKCRHDAGYQTGLHTISSALKHLADISPTVPVKPPPIRLVGETVSAEEQTVEAPSSYSQFDIGEIVCVKRSDGSLTYGRVNGLNEKNISIIVNEKGCKQIPWQLVPHNLRKIAAAKTIRIVLRREASSAWGFTPTPWSIVDMKLRGKQDEAKRALDRFSFVESGQPVASVVEGSAAESSGLMAQDVLQAVNDVDVRAMSGREVADLIKSASSTALVLLITRREWPTGAAR